MEMNVKINAGNIIIEGIGLRELLQQVYEQGKKDGAKNNNSELIPLVQLHKELKEKGITRGISVETLTRKAREANVRIETFPGNMNAVRKVDISKFISGY